LTATGTTCGECGSSKTVAWYNSPDVPGVKVCMKCYNDNLRQDNHTSKKKKK
jgi:Zn ribbon nucleic-acid-binding protein